MTKQNSLLNQEIKPENTSFLNKHNFSAFNAFCSEKMEQCLTGTDERRMAVFLKEVERILKGKTPGKDPTSQAAATCATDFKNQQNAFGIRALSHSR